MFLLNIIIPPHNDRAANLMAVTNTRKEKKTEVTAEKDQKASDQHETQKAQIAQSTQKQAEPPAPSFITNLNNVFNSIVLETGIKSFLTEVLNLNRDGLIKITTGLGRIEKAATEPALRPKFAFLSQVSQFGIQTFMDKLKKDYGIDDKFINAFDKLTKIIQAKGKISQEDIANDPDLVWLAKDEKNMKIIRFLFQKTVDHIMSVAKELIKAPQKHAQKIAEVALAIADKMINGGEIMSHKIDIQVASKNITGIGHQVDYFA